MLTHIPTYTIYMLHSVMLSSGATQYDGGRNSKHGTARRHTRAHTHVAVAQQGWGARSLFLYPTLNQIFHLQYTSLLHSSIHTPHTQITFPALVNVIYSHSTSILYFYTKTHTIFLC